MSPKAIVVMIACAFLALPIASAQGAWHGQDNEFGSIRVPYNADMEGERVPIEAKIVLRTNYADQDSRWFMFGFDVRNTPLDITFDNLVRTDTGEEMPCAKREGDKNSQIKCTVDLKEMPQPGTEILMRGTVGSSQAGMFQVGALVLPFTYDWMKVEQSSGIPAELYGSTQVNVRDCPGGCSGTAPLAGGGNFVPGFGALGLIAAVGAVAIGLAAYRRRG